MQSKERNAILQWQFFYALYIHKKKTPKKIFFSLYGWLKTAAAKKLLLCNEALRLTSNHPPPLSLSLSVSLSSCLPLSHYVGSLIVALAIWTSLFSSLYHYNNTLSLSLSITNTLFLSSLLSHAPSNYLRFYLKFFLLHWLSSCLYLVSPIVTVIHSLFLNFQGFYDCWYFKPFLKLKFQFIVVFSS